MNVKRIIGIGWDVGGWAGDKQGIAAVQWNLDSDTIDWIGIPRQISIPIGSMITPNYIVSQITESSNPDFDNESQVIIGVDAPLGYPTDFLKLLSGNLSNFTRPQREIDNSLAYRETDKHIFNEFNKKPLSHVFDKLGNNSTVAITHIQYWQDYGYSIHPRNKSVNDQKVIIEVYPALVKSSRSSEAKDPIKQLLPSNLQTGTDAYDAAICAIMAIAYGAEGRLRNIPKLIEPPTISEAIMAEGWIYHLPIGACR
ncbi:Hypothetical protein DPCES_3090 [Desulfitobacterium hafniense]|uniref:DUF429 domain-containing protein n=1 Tax=Desulfitobacterium hafniense TaxID=49338 RepID=A0A098B3N9_DESHA|nr:DUF429 domain-containing protein [Desulfitobacterium hafniense]CDX02977.1 Hypothetical protein DPCES_3090 [Desulfitobacterium hafniense]